MDDLDQLKSDCLACRRCKIGGCVIDEKFTSNVFSNMNRTAKIMVVGQNPGRDEVERGEPFVGVSGKLFDKVLEEVLGMKRSDCYLTNMIKCFTPGNRKPFMEEEEDCRYLLDREVSILKPRIIVTLGGSAFKQLTGMSKGIMKYHGNPVFSIRYKVNVFPMLHPSPFNTNDPVKRAIFYEDFKKLGEVLRG